MTARKPLWLISSAGLTNWPPALLTSTSSEPCAAITRGDELPRGLGLAHVADEREADAAVRRGSPRPSPRAARSRRPAIATRAPSSASSSAVARPMPVPPPVTSAERPVRLPSRRTLSTRRMIGGERSASRRLRKRCCRGPREPSASSAGCGSTGAVAVVDGPSCVGVVGAVGRPASCAGVVVGVVPGVVGVDGRCVARRRARSRRLGDAAARASTPPLSHAGSWLPASGAAMARPPASTTSTARRRYRDAPRAAARRPCRARARRCGTSRTSRGGGASRASTRPSRASAGTARTRGAGQVELGERLEALAVARVVEQAEDPVAGLPPHSSTGSLPASYVSCAVPTPDARGFASCNPVHSLHLRPSSPGSRNLATLGASDGICRGTPETRKNARVTHTT